MPVEISSLELYLEEYAVNDEGGRLRVCAGFAGALSLLWRRVSVMVSGSNYREFSKATKEEWNHFPVT
jgi:hypothetical protein